MLDVAAKRNAALAYEQLPRPLPVYRHPVVLVIRFGAEIVSFLARHGADPRRAVIAVIAAAALTGWWIWQHVSLTFHGSGGQFEVWK